MKSKIIAALSGLAMTLTAPAASASVTLDLGNTAGQPNAGALDGPDGNARFYSGNDGGNAFNLRITGWSISTGGTIAASWLGAYSGWGLGVTNPAESSSSPDHTIDNMNGVDFVLLQFDRSVILDQAFFNSIVYNTSVNGDTDASVGFGTTGSAWNASPLWNGQNASVLNSTFTTRYNSDGPANDNWRDINLNNTAANVWMISARQGTNNYADVFKLQGLTVSVPALPEPATWLTMLLGFGLIGGMIRADKRSKLGRLGLSPPAEA